MQLQASGRRAALRLAPAGGAGMADQVDPRDRAVLRRQRRRSRGARPCSSRCRSRSGRTIIVENRGGGGGTTCDRRRCKSADPDGHTILVHSNSLITMPAIQAMSLGSAARTFAGITPLGNVPLVLVISPEKKIKTLKELVDRGQGEAGLDQLCGRRHRLAAASDHGALPHRRRFHRPARAVQGRARGADGNHGRAGRHVFLPAHAGDAVDPGRQAPGLGGEQLKRASALPNVPTTVEAGFPNSDFEFWIGAMVPKQTPRDVVAKMHAGDVKAIEEPGRSRSGSPRWASSR